MTDQKRGKNYVFAFEIGFDDDQNGQPVTFDGEIDFSF
jgi:hypothetical protein